MKTLNRATALCLLLISHLNIIAQVRMTSDQIAEHTYSFTVSEGKIRGEGFELLSESIEGSQFFLLGEYHNEAGISVLTEALLPVLAKEGYKNFAIETGPISAAKLEDLGKTKDVEMALADFYKANTILTQDIPIPFFGGIEDAHFLEAAMKEDFNLWGLDQEYLGGYLFLMEEAWKSARMPEKYRADYEATRKKIAEYYANVSDEESSEIYNQILGDEFIQSFMEKLQKTSCNSCFDVVHEINASCEIYRDWKADLLENLEGRTDLMKEHFIRYYQKSAERKPKVFLKMGGMHTGRGFTGNADFEMGNLLHELARFNGMHDVNVAFATRYYLDDETGEIGDNLDYKSEWVENMRPLLEQGDKEVWKIIDLRPLKKLWINKRVSPGPQIKAFLKENDFVIIMPPLGESKPNYDEAMLSE